MNSGLLVRSIMPLSFIRQRSDTEAVRPRETGPARSQALCWVMRSGPLNRRALSAYYPGKVNICFTISEFYDTLYENENYAAERRGGGASSPP